jgi:hypothetical protein
MVIVAVEIRYRRKVAVICVIGFFIKSEKYQNNYKIRMLVICADL